MYNPITSGEKSLEVFYFIDITKLIGGPPAKEFVLIFK